MRGFIKIMRKVQRSEIIDYQTYEEVRPRFQKEVFAAKASRRIHVGECFTFLFENSLTIRYQVQEMMRVEKIVREKDILHELETYNGLLGEEGEVGCSLLIEIDDPVERSARLREWLRLPEHIYALTVGGEKIRPRFDPSQIGEDRLSSVQYLRFPLRGEAPAAIGIDLPDLELQTRLTEDQRAALKEDLDS
jgi:hypothetical protein